MSDVGCVFHAESEPTDTEPKYLRVLWWKHTEETRAADTVEAKGRALHGGHAPVQSELESADDLQMQHADTSQTLSDHNHTSLWITACEQQTREGFYFSESCRETVSVMVTSLVWKVLIM